MNMSTSMSLTKTKFVHAMYTYLEFGFTVLKLSALFDHINLTFPTKQVCFCHLNISLGISFTLMMTHFSYSQSDGFIIEHLKK